MLILVNFFYCCRLHFIDYLPSFFLINIIPFSQLSGINSLGVAASRAIEGITNSKRNKSSHNDDNRSCDEISIASVNFNSSLRPNFKNPVSLPLPLPHYLPSHISTNITDLRKSKSYKNDEKKLNLIKNINNNKIKLKSIPINNKNNTGIFEESQHFEKENNSQMFSDFTSVMTQPLSSSLPQSLPSLNNEGRDRNVDKKLESNNPMEKIEKSTWSKEQNFSKEIVSLADKLDLHSSQSFSAFLLTKGIEV